MPPLKFISPMARKNKMQYGTRIKYELSVGVVEEEMAKKVNLSMSNKYSQT
jgi:hypothetical protein